MATTNDYIAAQGDPNLLARFTAAAQMAGIDDAQNWAATNYGRFLAHKPGGTQSIVDIYAYAKDNRDKALAAIPPEPGANLAAVTDTNMIDAVTALSAPQE